MSILSKPYFHDEAAAFEHVESILWVDGPECPHCGVVNEAYKLEGVRSKPSKKHPEGVERHGLYKCRQCRKQFTVRKGTLFEETHLPLHKWLQAIYLLCSSKKGISSHQLARTLEITVKSAWFLSQRIREAMRTGELGPMGGNGGAVEADETYFGKVENPTTVRADGQPFKRSKAGRGPANKRAVLSLVERGGMVRSFHVDKVSKKSVGEIVAANINREVVLNTDESRLYDDVGQQFIRHDKVRHSAKEYVRGEAYTNTVEGYFSIFKRGMKGVYQHCSEKHLHRYLAEFDFRYNNRIKLGIDDQTRATIALQGISGKRLTYRGIDR